MLANVLPNVGDGRVAYDVKKIIFDGAIETHFQPIVSIRRKSIIGIEALSRGIASDGSLVPPGALFKLAAVHNLSLELDRLCRRKALENFAPLHRANPDLILFSNFHASSIEGEAETVARLAADLKINPPNVAVEVLESQFEDARLLRESIQLYRQRGFLVAIDDIGVGHSNLDRIFNVKPDILKADLSLVRDLHRDYHKQEVFQSLVNLSEKIAGWLITEGIEKPEEAIAALKMGADLMQGFYFARPSKIEGDRVSFQSRHLENVAEQFKEQMLDKIKSDNCRREEREGIARTLAARLADAAPEEFESRLCAALESYPVVESLCVVDAEDGVQFTGTIVNPHSFRRQKAVIFKPPPKGTDHSFKEHFFVIKETRQSVFETQPYVPLPSEKLCITTSTFFADVRGREFILCVHSRAE